MSPENFNSIRQTVWATISVDTHTNKLDGHSSEMKVAVYVQVTWAGFNLEYPQLTLALRLPLPPGETIC